LRRIDRVVSTSMSNISGEHRLDARHARSDASLLLRLRGLADQAFSRAAGAPLLANNGVRVLCDATENYPVWREAIRQAERYVLFESYIISDDEVGREFVELLAERARAGVKVRLLYDWLGTWGSRALWKILRASGAEVRCFNSPRIESPLGWVSRDHRKSICVDGKVGFVTGLCVSARWLGQPGKGIPPWRDTGLEIRGPAVAELDNAFASIWAVCGEPLDLVKEQSGFQKPADAGDAGNVSLRVVASVPSAAGLYRLDHIVAALARQRLWLTDAYFVGVTPYVQALGAAARDGVDVRLLVPGSSDIPAIAYLSRAAYRQLLESGVRIFEWNGTMLHAKTAVADDRWSRIGSTNLNIASWVANYELDVAIEDESITRQMATLYERDLGNATEIVLGGKRRTPRLRDHPERKKKSGRMWGREWGKKKPGSGGRAAAGALGIGSVVSAAVTNRRALGAAEATVLVAAGVVFSVLAAVAVLWPRALAFPFAVLIGWLGLTMFVRAVRLSAKSRAAVRKAQRDSKAA
jgi:cardiolipin synthase